jgi:hypothetical protein
METTREIPRKDWGTFFEDFSRSHRDHPVRVEVSGQDLGEQRLGEELALMGVGLETKGSAKGDIDIALRLKAPDGAMDHRIARPQRIYLEEDPEAGRLCLDIEDAENHKTLLYVGAGPTLH